MPRYRVDIDGAVYEGSYRTLPDAVYGALLKHDNDSYREWLLVRQQDATGGRLPPDEAKRLIGVEEIPQRGAPRGKARRVK